MSAILVSILLLGASTEPPIGSLSKYSESEIKAYNDLLATQKLIVEQPALKMATILLLGTGGVAIETAVIFFVVEWVQGRFMTQIGWFSVFGTAGLVLSGLGAGFAALAAIPGLVLFSRGSKASVGIHYRSRDIKALTLGLLCQASAARVSSGEEADAISVVQDSLCLQAISEITEDRWLHTRAKDQMLVRSFFDHWNSTGRSPDQTLALLSIPLISFPSLGFIFIAFGASSDAEVWQVLGTGLLLGGMVPVMIAMITIGVMRQLTALKILKGAQIAFGKQSVTAMLLPDFSTGGPGLSLALRF